ncbi:GTP 3',8-cyclase MoaA [candidate division KSB1 bacterium]
MTSPQQRLFDSLRLSVTDACNLGCIYCRPGGEGGRGGLTTPDEQLSFTEIARLVGRFKAGFGLGSVRITGGEPLLRPNLEELIGLLAPMGFSDLALTTNGRLLAPAAAGLKRAGLDRVNISLDSLNPSRYRHLTAGGNLAHTLAGIQGALDVGLHPVKLNMVVLKGLNQDEVTDILRFGLELGCEVRFLELMAMGRIGEDHGRYYVSNSKVRSQLQREFQLEPMESPPGRPARNYRVHDGRGRIGVVGFISPESESFCHGCGRLRLSAGGRLLGCLMYEAGIDLRPILYGPQDEFDEKIDRAVREVFIAKPRLRPSRSNQAMYSVGG